MSRDRLRFRAADYTAPMVFAAFTVAGAGYIVAAKALQLDAVWVTSIPILLMAAYSVALFSLRRLRLRDDQTGDNFYYMGFIFTLTSLAVSLVQFSSGGGVDEIVRNFGVAIASTIAGIVFRILFNLVRRDPIEVEHISRLELSDAARKVRRELDETLIDLAHFRRTNQQMLSEGFEEIRQEVERSASAAAEFIDKTSSLSEERVRAATQADSVEQIRHQLDRTAALLASINQSLEGVDKATAGAARAMARPTKRRWFGWWGARPAEDDGDGPDSSARGSLSPARASRDE